MEIDAKVLFARRRGLAHNTPMAMRDASAAEITATFIGYINMLIEMFKSEVESQWLEAFYGLLNKEGAIVSRTVVSALAGGDSFLVPWAPNSASLRAPGRSSLSKDPTAVL